MIIQQPTGLPQPRTTQPDQVFGEYTLRYFIEDNLLYILGVIFILVLVFGYARYVRNRKKEHEVEN